MSTLEEPSMSSPERFRWMEIRARYWREWVLLVDVIDRSDGYLESARVEDHDRSLSALLARIGRDRCDDVAYTAGERMGAFGTVELLDENGDVILPRRRAHLR